MKIQHRFRGETDLTEYLSQLLSMKSENDTLFDEKCVIEALKPFFECCEEMDLIGAHLRNEALVPNMNGCSLNLNSVDNEEGENGHSKLPIWKKSPSIGTSQSVKKSTKKDKENSKRWAPHCLSEGSLERVTLPHIQNA